MTSEQASKISEPTGFFAEVVGIYRNSRKEQDIFWNIWVARPLAALLIYFLRATPITPNQVTFLGAFSFLGVAAVLIALSGWGGMLLAAALMQFAYLLDCADGQLARLKAIPSEVGGYLDCCIDEAKRLTLHARFG